MPDTGLTRSPKVEKGALVQLIKELVGVVPSVIPFQYNPDKLSRWSVAEVVQDGR